MSYNDLRKGRWAEPGREYLVTAVVEGRIALFADLGAARACIRALAESDGHWLAWVLMPDHFHGLLSLNGDADLSGTVGRFKGLSARAVNRLLDRRGPLWQPGFHDRALRRDEDRVAVARYIVANPLRAGLVSRLADYPHWDSVWL
jgi:REP element-mobilizing transposase RayT